jgi:hypothetical protein
MSHPKRNTRFIRRTLYGLKRRYGGEVTFHRVLDEGLDLKTGKKNVSKQVWTVKKAIVLPSDVQPKFVYDLSYIANNKEFTTGGIFDTGPRRLVLDQRELGDYVPQIRDYFTFDGMRYEVVRLQRFEFNTGYIMVGQEVQGASVNEVHPEVVNHRCLFSDSASGVV